MWLKGRGHDAAHVRDLDLHDKPDTAIIKWANMHDAVIVTKDADFAHASRSYGNCKVVWLRHGNGRSADLIVALDHVIGEIEEALINGQHLIEVHA